MRGMVTLNQNRDFKRLYAKGKYYVHPVLVTYFFRNKRGETRIGITAGKKVGNAVKRNRAKRVIREAYRALSPAVKPGFDFVFVARANTWRCKSQEVARAMRAQLERAGVLR